MSARSKLKKQLHFQLRVAAFALLFTVGYGGFLLYSLLGDVANETASGVQAVAEMTDTSRRAQVAFQRQVQEWKDILLRGYDRELLAHHTAAFDQQYQAVQRELQQLEDLMQHQQLDTTQVEALLAKHAGMRERYLDTLRRYPPDRRVDNLFRADAMVRGIDRELSGRLDDLGRTVAETATERVATVSGAIQTRYEWQQYYLLSVLLFVLPGISMFSFYQLTRLARQLTEERERALVTLSSIGDAVIVSDVQGCVEYMNPVAEEMTGWPLGEAMGRPLKEVFVIVNELTRQPVASPVDEVLRLGQVSGLAEHTLLIARDGSEYPIGDSAAPVRNESGAITGAVLVFHDASEQMRAQREIRHLAYHDHLTGLPNRRLLQDRVRVALDNAQRHGNKLALLFIDLDHFKIINDTLGHDYGDLLLEAAAQRLVSCVRKQDTVARTGGDEFVMLLMDVKSVDDAANVAQKVLDALSASYQIKGVDLHSTPSIGISLYPEDGRDFETLLKHADTAMYHAKERGRAGYHFFMDEMNVRTLERLTIEGNLHKALARNEFELYYQPKMNIRDGKVIGAEALIRWNHPELGLVPPGKFIPIAEQSSIIGEIGEWVARAACVQSRIWQEMGMTLPLSFNVSARQFLHGDLPGMLTRILQETGADPGSLELELTEGVLLNFIEAEATLSAIKTMGLRIAIDDFGTGYSSLAYLRRMPIDTLKIDRTFVMHLESKPEDVSMVETIITMARNLGMTVIAEGVESRAQADILLASGCEACQGYFYGKPVPAAEFMATLRRAAS
ncbi:MAG: EAL domain-containing protein [Pseudomonadota bacterium]